MRRSTALINADVGEGLGLHSFGNDEALMPLIDMANVACGFHAGDPRVMARTVELAVEHEVRVGAHPGLPDLTGFGRRRMALTPEEVDDLITYQTGALLGFLRRVEAPLNHVKPHGALWGMLAEDPDLMRAAATATRRFGVAFVGLAGTEHEAVCRQMDVPFVAELYVDMDYTPQGRLALVRHAQATDPAEAERRVTTALEHGRVTSTDGTPVPVRFDSVCVHSDSATSVDVARAVRTALNG